MVTTSTSVIVADIPVLVRNACNGGIGSPLIMESSATPSVTGMVAIMPDIRPFTTLKLLTLWAMGPTCFSRKPCIESRTLILCSLILSKRFI